MSARMNTVAPSVAGQRRTLLDEDEDGVAADDHVYETENQKKGETEGQQSLNYRVNSLQTLNEIRFTLKKNDLVTFLKEVEGKNIMKKRF